MRDNLFIEEINAELVSQAMRGKKIVRLKGGDPFIFGRGGEEMLHLSENNIPFEA
jgi:siroheme synthase